jgi:large subunit ribosomal protein L31
MKADIHPKEYRPVVFKDSSSDYTALTRSCARTDQSIVWKDGKEYPLVLLGISASSHPFFTGQKTFVDTAGRVEKFSRRFGSTKIAEVKANAAAAVVAAAEAKKKKKN